MADINQIISLGIGAPADITHFITVGLSIGAPVTFEPHVVEAFASYAPSVEAFGRYEASVDAFASEG